MPYFEDMINDIVGQIESNETANDDNKQSKKVLVHCRAGQGRTGTVICIVNAILALRNMKKNSKNNENLEISLWDIFWWVRLQRNYMMETEP